MAEHTPHPTAPAASTTPATWHPRDAAAAAFSLRGLGAPEPVVRRVLDMLAAEGVRNPARFLRARTDAEREAYVREAEELLAEPMPTRQRRGDLMQIRTRPRWNWRTSSNQTRGVDCG